MKSAGFVIALCALAIQGCDEGGEPPAAASPALTATPPPAPTVAPSASSKVAAKPTNGAKGPFPESDHPAMKDPSAANQKAPDTYEGKFETTAGEFVVACTRKWAPHAADRFYNLLKIGFYNDVAIYRVHPGFVVQWGLHGNPAISGKWQKANIEPDKVTQKNKKGTLTFAQAGNPQQKGMTPLSRATQVFINYADNSHLDAAFAPVCKVTTGFEITEKFGGGKLHSHLKNAQSRIVAKGNDFLRKTYPELDYIKRAYVVGEEPGAPAMSASSKPAAAPSGSGKAKLEPEP